LFKVIKERIQPFIEYFDRIWNKKLVFRDALNRLLVNLKHNSQNEKSGINLTWLILIFIY